MLERQIMFKQLQELQRKKKLQELNDDRQQNVMNRLSSMRNKQSSGPQFGLANNGIPVRDPSQMFKFGDTKLGHGLSNQLVFSQAQNQVINGHSSSQYSQFQWPSHESACMLTKNKSQQAGTYSKSVISDQFNGSSNEDAATLDPLEQKILFNVDDNSWGSENFENTDNSSDVPSLQSGSWSALMQTAVAETSTSDGGPQEEWSGLSFQNTDVPKAETDDAFTPSYNNNSHSPYVGLRMGSSSQSPLVHQFDPSRISEHTVSTRNQLPNHNYTTNQSPLETLSYSESRHEASISDVSRETSHLVSVKKEDDQQWSTTRPPKIWGDVAFKNEKVYYENKVPQVTSLFQVNSAYGNYKNQSLDQVTKRSTQPLGNPERNGDVAKQNMAVLKSKKRKFPNFERLSWHKEVIEGCPRLHDMSATELEWAQSAGRLPAKLKELGEEIADSRGMMVNCKRRLTMTTQIMQLLFRPAPAIILSEDATAHCDGVTYYAAKLALGDACSLCSPLGNKLTSKSSSDQSLSKMIESFIDRSKRLEDELSRLEKGESTILEVRMDFQDLEKFSVINRFAKFHTRVALIKGDTASSSGAASSKPKLYPQRYVKASPMPDTVPEVQKCLSL